MIECRILNGERATWPLLSFIRTRCMIELALDKGKICVLGMGIASIFIYYIMYIAVLRLKAMNVEKEPVVVVPTQYPERKQRARSMH